MPFVLAFIGIIAVVVGVRGQSGAAGKLLASEFTGPNSFIKWFLAIMILGLIGYWDKAKPVSDASLGLLLVVMVLAPRNGQGGGGIFANLEDAFTNATPITAPKPAASQTGATPTATNGNPGVQGSQSLSNAGAQLNNLVASLDSTAGNFLGNNSLGAFA
jgi:hypothetical protein